MGDLPLTIALVYSYSIPVSSLAAGFALLSVLFFVFSQRLGLPFFFDRPDNPRLYYALVAFTIFSVLENVFVIIALSQSGLIADRTTETLCGLYAVAVLGYILANFCLYVFLFFKYWVIRQAVPSRGMEGSKFERAVFGITLTVPGAALYRIISYLA